MNIGNKVQVDNTTLLSNGKTGIIISIADNMAYIKFEDGKIIRFKEQNLVLVNEKKEKQKQKDDVKLLILFHSYTPLFFDVEKPEHMQCIDVEDAKENAAQLIEMYKRDGYTDFWMSIIDFPSKVDVEFKIPKLIKV